MKLVFRPVLTVATLLAFAALCSLGAWQLRRLAWKEDLMARVEARLDAAPIAFDAALARAAQGEDMAYQPVSLAGIYAHDLAARVFGTLDGAPGYYLFTPLDAPDPATGGRRFVYVNRGFAPQAADAATLGNPTGEATVTGLLRKAEAPVGVERLVRPKDQPQDNLYFARDPTILAARHGIETSAWFIDSDGRESAGRWPKGGTTRVEFPNRHLEYALTWFGLAAALIAVFLAYSRCKS